MVGRGSVRARRPAPLAVHGRSLPHPNAKKPISFALPRDVVENIAAEIKRLELALDCDRRRSTGSTGASPSGVRAVFSLSWTRPPVDSGAWGESDQNAKLARPLWRWPLLTSRCRRPSSPVPSFLPGSGLPCASPGTIHDQMDRRVFRTDHPRTYPSGA
jgi:hypothetical protein